MNDFLHDEYILNKFEEMKIVKEIFIYNLIKNHINTLHRRFSIDDEKRKELLNKFFDKKIKEKKSPKEIKLIEDAMKDDGLDTEGIYHALLPLTLNKEIDEDLYFKRKAFLDIFRVYDICYTYLDD